MRFKDHFSARAALYATHRPDYPEFLFSQLAAIPAKRSVACDCATGSGQAATGLARHFAHVVAMDASQSQLSHAMHASGISYLAAQAEHIPLPAGSVDLVTVAQALHWLDLSRFYGEVTRVLAPGGVLAAWGYGDPIVDDATLDALVHDFNRGTLESYWSPERMILLEGYATIPFPFREVSQPSFTLTRDWTLAELCGYLRTWSATAAYVERHGIDPVIALEAALRERWGSPGQTTTLRWPLYLRVGYA